MKGIAPLSASSDLTPVVTEVDRQLHGRLKQLSIDRCEEGLVLLGLASSFYVKQLAQHAVARMTRLPIVRNDIEVA